jgi:hypothetical protein
MQIENQYSTTSTNSTTNYVTLVEQTARFLKSVIFFDNLYANTSQKLTSPVQLSQIKALSNNFTQNSTQGGYWVLSRTMISMVTGGFSRVSDFY